MDLSKAIDDNTSNHVVKSSVPNRAKLEPCILGIDEAGRGPVLGPMVYGICYCPLSSEERLKEMKFADSKTLTEEKREELFESLAKETETLGWVIQIISPNVISNGMLRRLKYNLNAISHDAAMFLVETALKDGVNVESIFVDTVGDPVKYQAKLSERFPDIKVTVSKKADSLFPVVSAASICAKVARDRALKAWKFNEQIDLTDLKWGSGYPGDPATKSFLSENCDKIFGFPQIVRFSWSTCETILNSKAAAVQWEEVDENGSTTTTTPSVLSYFARKPIVESKQHQFFNERSLTRVTDLF